MKKKILLISLSFCILFNNSIALFAIDKLPVSSPSNVSTPVFEQIASVQAPFTIMNTLLGQGIPLFPEFKGPAKGNHQNDSSNNDSFGLLSANSKEIKSDCKYNNNIEKGKLISNIPNDTTFDRYLFYMKLLIGINSVFSIFMLMFLVSLSKSNLPWEINNLHM